MCVCGQNLPCRFAQYLKQKHFTILLVNTNRLYVLLAQYFQPLSQYVTMCAILFPSRPTLGVFSSTLMKDQNDCKGSRCTMNIFLCEQQHHIQQRPGSLLQNMCGVPSRRALSFHRIATFNYAAGDIWCQDYRQDFPWQMKAGAAFIRRMWWKKVYVWDQAHRLQNILMPCWKVLSQLFTYFLHVASFEMKYLVTYRTQYPISPPRL